MNASERPTTRHLWRVALRGLAAVGFVLAGANHFRSPKFYESIVPPGIGSPRVIVAVSGIAEIVGGLGLLIPRLRRPAGWGLIALLVAVFPANVYMAIRPERVADLRVPTWALWTRLPFQIVFVVWVWFVALSRGTRADDQKPGGF